MPIFLLNGAVGDLMAIDPDMVPATKNPIIIFADDDHLSWDYRKEEVDKYLRAQGIEADFQPAKSRQEIRDRLNAILKSGKEPAIVITDMVLEASNGMYVAEDMHSECFLDNQKQSFPKGKTLPVSVITGGEMMFWDEDINVSPIKGFFSNSVIEFLNKPSENPGITIQANAFRAFLHQALHLPPPEPMKTAIPKWTERTERPPTWQRGDRHQGD